MKNRLYRALILRIIVGAAFVASAVPAIHAQQAQQKEHPSDEAKGMAGMKTDGMNRRGDRVMGFDHTKTTHHFRLRSDGGAIEAEANDADDVASRDQIRIHIGHIAKMFAAGNFRAPMLIHDRTPPGVPVMQKLKDEINYKFEEMPRGARVSISTTNPEALQAIYDFLRFQIREHQTNDTLGVGGDH